jgi:hypothetical protein
MLFLLCSLIFPTEISEYNGYRRLFHVAAGLVLQAC